MTIIFSLLKQFLDQPPEQCWIWTGSSYGQGYGGVRLQSESPAPRAAYRVMYELFRGSIPPGLQLDHLCRVHRCVNPAHLEAVTCRENLRRGNGFIGKQMRRTHCPRGHALIEGNLIRYKGHKQCRECTLQRKRLDYHRMVANPEWRARTLERLKLYKRRKRALVRGDG